MTSSMTPNPASTIAELHVVTELVERQRDRVAAMAEPYLGTSRDDIVSSLHEAERSLLVATRSLRRALKTIE